jgi:hypothetical protein
MNMTGSNLTRLLIVATLLARWLDLCKNTSDPSGDSLLRMLSCDLAEMMAFMPFRDLFPHLQSWFVRKLCFRVRVLELKPVIAKYW